MIEKIKEKAKEKTGNMLIITVAFAVLVLAIGLFFTDYIRAFTIQENVSDELYRACNISIKTAMYDDYRKIAHSKYDENVAKNSFYNYLENDMKLTYADGVYTKIKKNGEKEYSLTNLKIIPNGNETRLEVTTVVETTPVFYGDVVNSFKIPISVKSRDMRTD